uniref:Si:ch211-175m2.5 n=1 Tax=Cyprinus carpio carpio TaxID=630221 RepID=A0A9J7X8N1_CYPCA
MSLRGVLTLSLRSNVGLLYSLSPASRAVVKTAATHTRSSSGRRSEVSSSSRRSEVSSRYPVPNKKNLPFDIVELMEEVEQKGGFLPNVFKVLAHRPAEFRAFFSYYNALMNKESVRFTGGLSKADRELIVVATSAHNHCLYCVVSHSALHRIYSKKPLLADQVAVNYRVAELSAREKAMLDFALTVCRSETITEEHLSSLEAHGFDREDIWDIAAIAAFFALSNRMAHLTDMRPNAEFYNMGRVPRDKEKASDGHAKDE